MADQTNGDSPNLSRDAADALLTAIAEAARGTIRDAESLHHLADAYAAVREHMPKRPPAAPARIR